MTYPSVRLSVRDVVSAPKPLKMFFLKFCSLKAEIHQKMSGKLQFIAIPKHTTNEVHFTKTTNGFSKYVDYSPLIFVIKMQQ